MIMMNMLPKLPEHIAKRIANRYMYYKGLHDREQITSQEYLAKLAILKYDLNSEINKLDMMECGKTK